MHSSELSDQVSRIQLGPVKCVYMALALAKKQHCMAPCIASACEHGGKPSFKPETTAPTCFPTHLPAFCTGLFSATQTEAVVQLARAGLRNAVRIKVAVVPSAEQQQQQSERVASGQTAGPSGAQRTPSSLEIQYQICDSVQKLQQLVKFMQVGLQSFLTHRCVLVMDEMYCWCSVDCAAFTMFAYRGQHWSQYSICLYLLGLS